MVFQTLLLMNAEKSLTFRLPTMKMLTGNPGKQ
jgi:hypothetical protein